MCCLLSGNVIAFRNVHLISYGRHLQLLRENSKDPVHIAITCQNKEADVISSAAYAPHFTFIAYHRRSFFWYDEVKKNLFIGNIQKEGNDSKHVFVLNKCRPIFGDYRASAVTYLRYDEYCNQLQWLEDDENFGKRFYRLNFLRKTQHFSIIHDAQVVRLENFQILTSIHRLKDSIGIFGYRSGKQPFLQIRSNTNNTYEFDLPTQIDNNKTIKCVQQDVISIDSDNGIIYLFNNCMKKLLRINFSNRPMTQMGNEINLKYLKDVDVVKQLSVHSGNHCTRVILTTNTKIIQRSMENCEIRALQKLRKENAFHHHKILLLQNLLRRHSPTEIVLYELKYMNYDEELHSLFLIEEHNRQTYLAKTRTRHICSTLNESNLLDESNDYLYLLRRPNRIDRLILKNGTPFLMSTILTLPFINKELDLAFVHSYQYRNQTHFVALIQHKLIGISTQNDCHVQLLENVNIIHLDINIKNNLVLGLVKLFENELLIAFEFLQLFQTISQCDPSTNNIDFLYVDKLPIGSITLSIDNDAIKVETVDDEIMMMPYLPRNIYRALKTKKYRAIKWRKVNDKNECANLGKWPRLPHQCNRLNNSTTIVTSLTKSYNDEIYVFSWYMHKLLRYNKTTLNFSAFFPTISEVIPFTHGTIENNMDGRGENTSDESENCLWPFISEGQSCKMINFKNCKIHKNFEISSNGKNRKIPFLPDVHHFIWLFSNGSPKLYFLYEQHNLVELNMNDMASKFIYTSQTNNIIKDFQIMEMKENEKNDLSAIILIIFDTELDELIVKLFWKNGLHLLGRYVVNSEEDYFFEKNWKRICCHLKKEKFCFFGFRKQVANGTEEIIYEYEKYMKHEIIQNQMSKKSANFPLFNNETKKLPCTPKTRNDELFLSIFFSKKYLMGFQWYSFDERGKLFKFKQTMMSLRMQMLLDIRKNKVVKMKYLAPYLYIISDGEESAFLFRFELPSFQQDANFNIPLQGLTYLDRKQSPLVSIGQIKFMEIDRFNYQIFFVNERNEMFVGEIDELPNLKHRIFFIYKTKGQFDIQRLVIHDQYLFILEKSEANKDHRIETRIIRLLWTGDMIEQLEIIGNYSTIVDFVMNDDIMYAVTDMNELLKLEEEKKRSYRIIESMRMSFEKDLGHPVIRRIQLDNGMLFMFVDGFNVHSTFHKIFTCKIKSCFNDVFSTTAVGHVEKNVMELLRITGKTISVEKKLLLSNETGCDGIEMRNGECLCPRNDPYINSNCLKHNESVIVKTKNYRKIRHLKSPGSRRKYNIFMTLIGTIVFPGVLLIVVIIVVYLGFSTLFKRRRMSKRLRNGRGESGNLLPVNVSEDGHDIEMMADGNVGEWARLTSEKSFPSTMNRRGKYRQVPWLNSFEMMSSIDSSLPAKKSLPKGEPWSSRRNSCPSRMTEEEPEEEKRISSLPSARNLPERLERFTGFKLTNLIHDYLRSKDML
ncbi:hypothetical protein SNEBB_001553 [Seison nebaliae]|nr:hypothetical protein SNEBB_001553 [Seison nebaliae]